MAASGGLRRRLGALTVTVLVAGTAAACSGSDEKPAAAPTTASATPSPTPTPSPTVPGLSGGPVLGVKIDNTPSAYPRIGLSAADVVYVEPVEGGLTRLLAVFANRQPAKVGPIRSARMSDVDLLANYGRPALAYSGVSNYTQKRISKGQQVNLSFDEGGAGFSRDGSRPAPYNVIGNPAALLKRAGKVGPLTDIGFRYGDPITGGTAATKVSTAWLSAKFSASYAAGAGTYTVSTDGRKEIDALTGKALRPATIVIQNVKVKDSGNRDVNGNATPSPVLTGTGKVTVLRDGKVWRGTWSRPKATSPTVFAVGDERLMFAPGQVWVLLVPNGQKVTVS